MTVMDAGLASTALDVTMSRGGDAVMSNAQELRALADAIADVPATARWPWVAASVAKPQRGVEPWMVALHAGRELVGAAVLVDDLSANERRTTLAGTAGGHRGELLARDGGVAVHLGAALADALRGEPREFSIGPISDGPAVATLLNCLQVDAVIEEVSVPFVLSDPEVATGMSPGVERTIREAHNRLATDGVRVEFTRTNDRGEITSMLPFLESISRDWDLAAGRTSRLDDPSTRRLSQRRMLALATDGILQLSMLWLDGEVAAFVLAIDDGAIYRVLGGRYVSRWARYAPGRVLESAVLTAVIESPTHRALDWMLDVASDTLVARNGVDPLVVISGRS